MALALTASPAAAETDVGAWLGPRLFSSQSRLGYIDDAPEHPVLSNSMAFGGRLAHRLLPWLVPELELAFSPTKTTVTSADAASVLWLEPRLHVRLELWPGLRVTPFAVVGGGMPISLSGASKTFATSITGGGYLGGGVRFDTHKGFVLRFDARLAMLPSMPGSDFGVTSEFDIGFGLEFQLGSRSPSAEELARAKGPPAPDADRDGVADADDRCPDRAEDLDGFEDDDGCPDIDNDLDRVLDIADRCPNVRETYNGFEDGDGCPDSLPDAVDALRGTIEGLLYAEGETAVRDSAQPALRTIAKTMTTHPSIRVQLIGHTDDIEAKQFQTAENGQSPPDLATVSADLSRARAEAVKNALIALGIPAARILVEGHGFDDPVSDNTRPRGRLANRRVEIKLYIPPR